jgi:putative transcriptional regulator
MTIGDHFSIRAARRSRSSLIVLLCLLVGPFNGIDSMPAAERGKFLTGQLLVATEDMRDPRFAESVIYMIKHDEDGAMGLVINKPIANALIDDLLESSGRQATGSKRDIVVHYGGPVGPRQGFLLHSDEHSLEGTTKIADGIAMTTDSRMLEAIASGKGPRQMLFALGYAGWAPGQLEMELKTQSWVTVPGDKGLIFGADAAKKWRQAIDKQQVPL